MLSAVITVETITFWAFSPFGYSQVTNKLGSGIDVAFKDITSILDDETLNMSLQGEILIVKKYMLKFWYSIKSGFYYFHRYIIPFAQNNNNTFKSFLYLTYFQVQRNK